ncbi:hypothetical protein [Persephonella sp.]
MMKAPPIIKGSEKYASHRKILYEKKINDVIHHILWQEPDGKVYLQSIYSHFAYPKSLIRPCTPIGNGKYKCVNATIDTMKNKMHEEISLKYALKESPILNSVAGFLKDTALKTVIIGIITGLAVYTLTRVIDSTLKEARA